MPKRKYKNINFRKNSLYLINIINSIIEEYDAQGYSLTLRQVYYQLVARDYIENSEKSYKNIGKLVSNGRLAGLIDWYAIIDRTRNLRGNSHWETPIDVINSAKYSYMLDKWERQPNYVEVWIEKDALVGVISKSCTFLDVPYFSCRGYTSQSEMWSAAQRFINQKHKSSRTIIHLGDHDPSGIDMSRDIQERLEMFGADVFVNRVALNMEQIKKFSPPPNPTKLSDSRATKYISEFGYECWELDALEPKIITELIEREVSYLIDFDLLDCVREKEQDDKEKIQKICDNYDDVVEYLDRISQVGDKYE